MGRIPSSAPDDQQTPADAAVVAAIRDLHAVGLKMMLKPHVDVKDGSWRGTIRPPEQANCCEAAFEVWSKESAWMRGTFWWAWPVDPANPGDTDYSSRGKPAEGILSDWYGR